MSASVSFLRGTFLYLSRQKTLRRWMETSRHAEKLTSRFIAGLELQDAIRVARELKRRSMLVSLDHLGENVTSQEEARAAREAYLNALALIAAEDLGATVSAKLTALGLDISEDLCVESAAALVQKACSTGSRIELDMEDSSYTERTLRIVHDLHGRCPAVRAVIQAYLYRSEADVEDLCRRAIPVRLCKGAYKEPQSVAWPNKADVDQNFVKLMEILFDRGAYPAIATHDEAILRRALDFVKRRGISPDQFEFQMLYGVRRGLQQHVVERGFRLRLYVPYGTAWYPYFMRRLAERPANVMFIAKSLVRD